MYRQFIKGIEKFESQIHEEIVQEKFRQLLIKYNIADNYIIEVDDLFEFEKDNNEGIGGTINIFKDNKGIWNVWENIDEEIFCGYYKTTHYDIKRFNNQIDAYIDGAKRRDINLNLYEFEYDTNDIDGILKTIESAQDYLLAVINFYTPEFTTKIYKRYLLLNDFKKQIITKLSNKEKTSSRKLVKTNRIND